MQHISEIFENQVQNPSQVEDLLYIFADQKVLLTQPKLIRRYNEGGDRFYWYIDGGELSMFPSTTTFVSRVLGYGHALIEWYKKHGDNADVMRDQAADFGTLMHICCAEYHLVGYDFSKTRKRVEDYIKALGHPLRLVSEWTMRLNKAVASWAKFVEEYNFKPVLIEGMLASDSLGIAGTIDYVGYMTIKGQEYLVQIDLKSGGIHESAEAQLAINKVIFEENFPHLQIEKLFNWSPKDYRKEPTFTLVDQTDSEFNTEQAINAMLKMYDVRYSGDMSSKTTHVFTGEISPSSSISDHARAVTLAQMITNQY